MELHAPSIALGALTPFMLAYLAKWTVRVFAPAFLASLKLVPETIADVLKAFAAAVKGSAAGIAKGVTATA